MVRHLREHVSEISTYGDECDASSILWGKFPVCGLEIQPLAADHVVRPVDGGLVTQCRRNPA